MTNTWFTSDTHFGHKRVIEYCNRPYSSVEEMDESIIEIWNSVVKPDDTLWFLGDFAFTSKKRVRELLERLNGKKFITLGNHDRKRCHTNVGWASVVERSWNMGGLATLSHYPHPNATGPHLHGHRHGNTETHLEYNMDVGWDVWGRPVDFETLISEMRKGQDGRHICFNAGRREHNLRVPGQEVPTVRPVSSE